MSHYTIESSHAFIKACTINPHQKGLLTGLTFGVKDIIDVSGHITGCGNPSWKKQQRKAISNAFCIDQLLSQGATCVGKTHTDEFAFSLLGENHFYGTPLNPLAPDRVPGGSSSGSASAVACGLVDFAIGTDTGGSVRIPASNCGILGYRPTHGRVSVAGVHSFAPTFDTVGLFSRTYETLSKTASVLLGEQDQKQHDDHPFYILKDAFDISDENIRNILLKDLQHVCHCKTISFSDIFKGDRSVDIDLLFQTYCPIQWAEIWNTHGPIIRYQKPDLGSHAQKNFEITSSVDRAQIQEPVQVREWFSKKMNQFLQNKILLMPTSPTLPPKKGSIGKDRRSGNYYPRTLGLTAISGLARLPQLSIPFSQEQSIPIGLSLLKSQNQDMSLIAAAKKFNT